jgi:hypothetical protein
VIVKLPGGKHESFAPSDIDKIEARLGELVG